MMTQGRRIVASHSRACDVASGCPGRSVHKISIVQRGFGALGYTMQLPLEERYLLTREDLLSQLAVLLAGRTAEEIKFGHLSTGAQNDLQRATDIARAMVTEFGMSDLVGLVNHNAQAERIPGNAVQQSAALSKTALVIDNEVKRIIGERRPRTSCPCGGARRCGPVGRLLEKEVIESDELKAIMGPLPPKSPDAVPPEIPPPSPA